MYPKLPEDIATASAAIYPASSDFIVEISDC